MNKGQVFATDFVASITIFSLFLLFFGLAWNSSVEVFLDDVDSQQTQAHDTFSLIKTEGAPENWGEGNVSVIGLYDGAYLSAEKFLRFSDLGLADRRRLLRTQEYLLEAEYLNGSVVMYEGQDLVSRSSDIPQNRSVYVESSLSVLDENRKRVRLNYYSWEG